MKHFGDIENAFEITKNYIHHWYSTLDDRDTAEVTSEFNRLLLINESAYFILLFTQLETKVNQLCEDAIRSGSASADSNHGRAWKVLEKKGIRNIHFKDRVALLTNRGGTVYNSVERLYQIRNNLAHGDLLAESLDVAEVASEIQSIAVSLKGVP